MKSVKNQIVISGVGGQGVLFITRLLAEAAIKKGFSTFTSETHGMAQRGGTVLSHLKVGDFSSPLIMPKKADGLLALKPESIDQHGYFLKSGGWTAVNSDGVSDKTGNLQFSVDAGELAQKIKDPRSVNLVMLGFILGLSSEDIDGDFLFCSKKDIRDVLEKRLQNKKKLLNAAITALETGFEASLAAT